METDRKLEKAKLIQINWDTEGKPKVVDGGMRMSVQFNPATLRVSYANQVQTNDQSTSSATQFVGRGSSKMSIDLLFDVSMPIEDSAFEASGKLADVREVTRKVVAFITPKQEGQGKDEHFVPPGLRFEWGSFSFDGIVESLDETLELWSEDGRPLRAGVTLSLSQQGIIFNYQPRDAQAGAPPGARPAGTTPLQPARADESIQGMLARSGATTANWKAVASANGIENPRQLRPGQLINLNIQKG
jgi:hypothetical protein